MCHAQLSKKQNMKTLHLTVIILILQQWQHLAMLARVAPLSIIDIQKMRSQNSIRHCHLCISTPNNTFNHSQIIDATDYKEEVLDGRCLGSGIHDFFCDAVLKAKIGDKEGENTTATECRSIIS